MQLLLELVQYLFVIQNRCCNRRKTEIKKEKIISKRHYKITIWNHLVKQKKKTRLQTYDLYYIFVHCCICRKRTAHGEGFRMTSLTEKLCVTTTTYSPSRTRTASACLIKSCKNWSSQKEKSMVAPIKRSCLLWIPKAFAMQILPRKRTMMREKPPE